MQRRGIVQVNTTTQLNMSNDYFKAQGWFKNYATSSEDSRGMFQQLVKEDEEAFRIASAETDRIKDMINEKFGPGTMKPASELPPVQNPFDDFEDRNPMAGIEDETREYYLKYLEDRPEGSKGEPIPLKDFAPEFIRENAAEGGRMLNAVQMGEAMGNRTGFATPKGTGIPLSKEELQLLKDNLTKKEFETLKFGQPSKKNDLDIGVKARQNPKLFRRVQNILTPGKVSTGIKILNNEKLSNALIKSTNAGDDIETIITKMNKLDKTLSRNKISSAINSLVQRGQINEEFGRVAGKNLTIGDQETYNKIIEEAVDEGKLNRAQIARKAGVSASVVEDWIKENKGNDFYKKNFDYESGRLKTNNLQTRKDLFEFVENSDNITAKEISERFGLDSKKTQKTMADLVSDIYRMRGSRPGGSVIVPYNEPERMKNVLDKVRDAPDFNDIYERRIETLVMEAYPEGSKAKKQAKKSLSEYRKFSRALRLEFPELALALDHVVPFKFLKEIKQGANPINLIRVKPTISTVNRFKANFDIARIEINRLNKLDPNNPKIKKRLNILNDLQKNIGIEFGGTSKGGYVYNFGAQPIGKSDLISDAKKAIDDYQKVGNFSKKVLADENLQKQLIEAGVGTGKDMSVFKRIKPLDEKKLKEIEKYITDTTGKVKMPKFSSQSGFIDTDLLGGEQLKKIINSEGFKNFKANIANPALKTAVGAAKLPTKIFGGLDLVLGYLDYSNNRQKGFSKADSTKHMVDAVLFGATSFGKKADIAGVREIANKNGMSNEVFDNLMALNTNQKKMMNLINKSKAEFNESMDIIESGAADPTAEKMLIQKLKVDTKKSLTNTMKNIVKDSRSLETNLQVQEAGAPININVNKEKAFSDLGSSSREFVQNRIDASDLENIANQKDTTKGGIGDAAMSGLKAMYTQPKFLYDAINPFSPLPKAKEFFPKDLNYKDQMKQLKKEDPTMYYKMLQSEGIDPRINLNIPVQLEFEQKYPQFGNQMSDTLTQNKAEGGIIGLRSKYEYKK